MEHGPIIARPCSNRTSWIAKESQNEELEEIARRLRMARASLGLSQAQAAREASISQSALSLYEKARREPHATSIKRLAMVYEISMD